MKRQWNLHTLYWFKRKLFPFLSPPLLPLQRPVATVCLERKFLCLFLLLPTTPPACPLATGSNSACHGRRENRGTLSTAVPPSHPSTALATCRKTQWEAWSPELRSSGWEGLTSHFLIPSAFTYSCHFSCSAELWEHVGLSRGKTQLQCHEMCYSVIMAEVTTQTLKGLTKPMWNGDPA